VKKRRNEKNESSFCFGIKQGKMNIIVPIEDLPLLVILNDDVVYS
jgi:hypothetical protein